MRLKAASARETWQLNQKIPLNGESSGLGAVHRALVRPMQPMAA
jgi:hypothetical protein